MGSLSVSSSRNAWARAKVLPGGFFERDTIQVARELLGKILWVEAPGKPAVAGRIVETEAYTGDDPAAHSSRGETPRTSVMFGEPGVAYVYFIYGMYEMLNFVTEPKGRPGAVLIRALEPVLGEETMAKRRNMKKKIRLRNDLTSGPGKLCRALGIEMRHNGMSLQGPVLRVIDDGFSPERVSASPRVGISRATDRLWRFFITDHPFVSRVAQNKGARVLR